ncbi:hypothetical protein WCN79_01465 [Xanthomonas axonopodis pv. vasculorum]|uniref:hypothetical protein n=1 Tax=Xanthomonas axonopodis TaxID=53413 RepID=UPI000ABD61B4|nr:hypothetical protein [Xanthomonas axonopodis]
MPKGLISALWHYSRPMDAGATAQSAKNALFSGRFVCIGERCANARSLYVRSRCDDVAHASLYAAPEAAQRISCLLLTKN